MLYRLQEIYLEQLKQLQFFCIVNLFLTIEILRQKEGHILDINT